MDNERANVWLGTGADETCAVSAALAAATAAGLLEGLSPPAVLLRSRGAPLSGRLGQTVMAFLHTTGLASASIEPPSLRALRRSSWRRQLLERPDVRLAAVTLLSSIVDAATRIALISIRPDDAAASVLNLLTRYAHPRLRLVLAASRERDALAAELNLACRLDLLVITGPIGHVHVAAVTRDRIAAELFGLALHDEPLLGSHELAGPWEDALVQRATELDLGVAVPSQLRVHHPPDVSGSVSEALNRIRLRLGVPPDAGTGEAFGMGA